MKRCPECRRDYHDDSLLYCLDDGGALVEGPRSPDEPATAILPKSVAGDSGPSDPSSDVKKNYDSDPAPEAISRGSGRFDPASFAWGAVLLLVLGAAGLGIWYFSLRGSVAAVRNIRFPI